MNLKPVKILIAALGGEGGGVLADWIVHAAAASGYPVQATSIPGVAQRTGATTYYLEIFPQQVPAGGKRPILALNPMPGDVDLLAVSELLECGRMIERGMVSRQTAVVSSTHRIYAVAEKMQMGDGRFATAQIIAAASALAGRAVLFDMDAITRAHGTVISATLFGAMAGANAWPLTRDACEAAIRAGGKGTQASLAAFADAYARALGRGAQAAATLPGQPSGAAHITAEWLAALPVAAREFALEGERRCAEFQDAAYAKLYRERLAGVAAFDSGDGALTRETARYLALWMCFDDLIRVAAVKISAARIAEVRAEVQARPGETLHVIEFLKPGIDEFASLLPVSPARRVLAWARRNGHEHKLNVGMHLRTTGLAGFLMLRLMAALKPWRPRSARYAEEQALIVRWLAAVHTAGAAPELALEIAQLGRLIKGYGDTNRRGKENFSRILETLVDGRNWVADTAQLAAAVRVAREAALANPDEKHLDGKLADFGVKPRPLRAVPINFVKPPRGAVKPGA
ncbi:MAG TPA: indolepyruvate oxidoreductase subunit beta family protein [Burkholderiales bacterium]